MATLPRASHPSRRSATHRYGSPVLSEDDDTYSSVSQSEYDVRDSISVHVPRGAFHDERNASEGETTRSAGSAAKSAPAEAEQDDARSTTGENKESKFEKYFSRCVARVYEAFGDQCPQPEAPDTMLSPTSQLGYQG